MSDTIKDLKEKLFNNRKNGALTVSSEVICEAESYCEDYKSFLNTAKTEREAVAAAIRLAESKGFCKMEQGKTI